MPPKTGLRSLLRKDILRSRVSTASGRGYASSCSKKTLDQRRELDNLFNEKAVRMNDKTSESDTDSLFREVITKTKSREEVRQEKLQRFLSEGFHDKCVTQNVRYIENPELKEMRKELEILVTREIEASTEQKSTIRNQKRDLIRKIAIVEAEEKGRKARELRSTIDKVSRTIQAMEPNETKKLKIKAEKLSKTMAGFDTAPLKRNRQNTDNDLDGEERLRIGKSYKRRATNITGHWGTTLHDYFPVVEGKDCSIDRNMLTPAQKLLNRMELAQLGETLAKAERKKRLLKH